MADGFVRVWDPAIDTSVFEIDRRPAGDHRAVTLTPDGQVLVTGDGAGIRLWNVANGAAIRTLTVTRGNTGAVAVSPDGREIVTAGDPYTPGLLRWDTATGAELPFWALPSPIEISRIAFSPDGRWVGGHAGAGVTIWDVKTRDEVFTAPDAAPTLGTAALA